MSERGEGGTPTEKKTGGGLSGSARPGSTLPLPYDHLTPLVLTRRGSPPSSSRLTLHAKRTFWHWNLKGVVPPPLKGDGGRGPGHEKNWQGGGGCLVVREGDYPPCHCAGRTLSYTGGLGKMAPCFVEMKGVGGPPTRIFLGRGEVMGRSFLRTFSLRSDLF